MLSSGGTLYLIPTPLSEEGGENEQLREHLLKAFERGETLIVEDERPARRRWRSWGLPREAISHFITYNEHSPKGQRDSLLAKLKKGVNAHLQSDGGMPGFCDPGRDLIFSCQREGLKVRTLPFYNSLIPAVAMSGFTEGPFSFLGFPPREKEKRRQFFLCLASREGRGAREVSAFMDTPYRLERVVQELGECLPGESLLFMAMDIGRPEEEHFWGKAKDLREFSRRTPLGKREFVVVVN